MPMTAVAANKAKPKDKSYKLSDEKGLYLHVMPNGSKYWRLKYRFGGKEKVLALGVHPEIGLKDAREKRDQARKLICNGVDPSDVKRTQKAIKDEATENSFKAVALEWFSRKMTDKSEGHQDPTMRALEKDFSPLSAAILSAALPLRSFWQHSDALRAVELMLTSGIVRSLLEIKK